MQELILPLLIGSLGVLQNTLNKKFSESIGIAPALLINNFILLLIGISFYFFIRLAPPNLLPDFFRIKTTTASFSWKYMLPGIFGFFIIAIIPYTIQKVGATKVFLAVIVAQLVTSILWDYFIESTPVTWPKIAGATLAVLGAIVSVL